MEEEEANTVFLEKNEQAKSYRDRNKRIVTTIGNNTAPKDYYNSSMYIIIIINKHK